MRPPIVLSIVLVFTSCVHQNPRQINSLKNEISKNDSTEKLYRVETEDAEMNNAIQQAKKTLSVYDSALKSGNKYFDYFSIKKRYKTATGGEHMWINQIVLFKNGYKGIVNNDATETQEVQYGDTVFVDKNDISDWMYIDNNVLRGGYTLRVAINHMTKDEKEKFIKELGYTVPE